MNTILWILQIIICIKFLSVAYSHGLQKNNSTMQNAINKYGRHGMLTHKIISIILLIGSVVIILPGIIKLDNWVTIFCALILAGLMLISIYFHIRSREKPLIVADIILFAIVLFIAIGRGLLAPL